MPSQQRYATTCPLFASRGRGCRARRGGRAGNPATLPCLRRCKQSLRSWFENDDGAITGLYDEHYKLIRDMTVTTPRPAPLINDEASRQVGVLERLRAKVYALEALRARDGEIAVLDANALMHYQRPDEIPVGRGSGCPRGADHPADPARRGRCFRHAQRRDCRRQRPRSQTRPARRPPPRVFAGRVM